MSHSPEVSAAQRDREYARTMAPTMAPLFCYISNDGPMMPPHSTRHVNIVTVHGIKLGTGILRRGKKSDNTMRLTATIDGRRFWGRTPTHSGTYTRLRPYRKQ